MTRSAIITGLALALTVGAVPALSQEGEEESRDAIAQITRLAQESAAEHVSGRAEPVPETPDMLPALWEQIKANADTVPMRDRAESVPETPDMLSALWEQIKANADLGPDETRE